MPFSRRAFLGSAAATVLAFPARAQMFRAGATAIRIGLMDDMSGPYRDLTGPNGVACAAQAIKEFTDANPDFKVELVVADHQNKPDVGSTVVREWCDRGDIDMVMGMGNSAVAISCMSVLEQKDKVGLITTAASSELTSKYCSANTIHWTFDTWCTAHAPVVELAKAGKNSWFIIRADYTFGKTLTEDTTKFVNAAGGKVIGEVAFPFPGTTDFSSFLLTAQASGAKVIAFATAGQDTVNCIKQAHEFGLQTTSTIVALSSFVNDAQSAGLDIAQNLLLTETFYWNLNDRTRSFYNRMKPLLPTKVVPNRNHAGNYSAVTHYLKVAKAGGTASIKGSGRAFIDAMKAMPTDDDCFGPGSVRIDGRKIHPAYLFKVKSPATSKAPDDIFELVSTTPADQAFRPLSEGSCKLVKT